MWTIGCKLTIGNKMMNRIMTIPANKNGLRSLLSIGSLLDPFLPCIDRGIK